MQKMKNASITLVLILITLTVLSPLAFRTGKSLYEKYMLSEEQLPDEFSDPDSIWFCNRNVLTDMQASLFLARYEAEGWEANWDSEGYLFIQRIDAASGKITSRSFAKKFAPAFEKYGLSPTAFNPKVRYTFTEELNGKVRIYVFISWTQANYTEYVAAMKAAGYTSEQERLSMSAALSYLAENDDGTLAMAVYDADKSLKSESCVMIEYQN